MPKAELTSASFDKDFSYIAGVIFGDGSLTETLKKGCTTPNHKVVLQNTDINFVKEFAAAIARLIGPGTAKIYSFNTGFYKTTYRYARHTHWLYNELNKNLNELLIREPLYFLKGFFDSEGCVTFKKHGTRLSKRLIMSNTDIATKEYIQKILEDHEIHYNIVIIKTKTRKMKDGHMLIPTIPFCFNITIETKQAIQRFSEIMPKLIPAKQEKLELLLKEMNDCGFVDEQTGIRIHSKNARKNSSIARTKYWETHPEEKQRAAKDMSKTVKSLWKEPKYREIRRKISSEQMKKKWQIPEFREHMSKIISKNKTEWWAKQKAHKEE